MDSLLVREELGLHCRDEGIVLDGLVPQRPAELVLEAAVLAVLTHRRAIAREILDARALFGFRVSGLGLGFRV